MEAMEEETVAAKGVEVMVAVVTEVAKVVGRAAAAKEAEAMAEATAEGVMAEGATVAGAMVEAVMAVATAGEETVVVMEGCR